MASICGSSIQACGMRVTLLNDTGNVANQANNFWVTDNLTEIQVTPDVSEGPERELRSGCDCIIASSKQPDLLKRFTFTINLGTLEPGMLALMLGTTVISSGADLIGVDWPDSGISCAGTPPPKVALEVWSFVWDGAGQSGVRPYWHWVWPLTRWQVGQFTLNSDFATIPLSGFSLGNAQWGFGPYNDDPGTPAGELGSVWQTATVPPTATCSYGSVTPSS